MPASNPKVLYWEIDPTQKTAKRTYYQCFSGLNGFDYMTRAVRPMPPKVRYLALVNSGLLVGELKFFLDYLSNLLDTSRYTYKIVKCGGKTKTKRVLFNLNTEGLNRMQTLFYLTAFRMVDEFPEVIKDFFLSKDKVGEELFLEFQKAHFKHAKTHYNMSGHGLMYWGYGSSVFSSIDLPTFKANLTDKNITSVQSFFKKKSV